MFQFSFSFSFFLRGEIKGIRNTISAPPPPVDEMQMNALMTWVHHNFGNTTISMKWAIIWFGQKKVWFSRFSGTATAVIWCHRNSKPSSLRPMFNTLNCSPTSGFHMRLDLGLWWEICQVYLCWVHWVVAVYMRSNTVRNLNTIVLPCFSMFRV